MSKRLKLQLALLPPVVSLQQVCKPLHIWQLPPQFLRRLVGGRVNDKDFIQGSQKWMKRIVKDSNLSPDATVLDIGCGCGAGALVFREFLNARGSYEGFDIYHPLIYWCQNMIEKYDQRFHFRLANIYNNQYNPTGTIHADHYRFMYPDNYFNAVFAWSVFTHLTEADAEHYIHETSRVLKPGGHLWFSFFLMRPEAKEATSLHQSALDFAYQRTPFSWSTQTKMPEVAMAYDEKIITKWCKKAGLTVTKTRYGNWIKRNELIDFQDVVVARKI